MDPYSGYSNGDVYYTFPALQSWTEGDDIIIQPVLQYGFNGGFGSVSDWYMASWSCDERPGGDCVHSTPVLVSQHDTLFGLVQSSNCSGGTCDWDISTINRSTGDTTSVSLVEDDDLFTLAIGGDVELLQHRYLHSVS